MGEGRFQRCVCSHSYDKIRTQFEKAWNRGDSVDSTFLQRATSCEKNRNYLVPK